MSQPGWENVRDAARDWRRNAEKAFDLCIPLRVAAWRDHDGEAETLVRAHAMARVLDETPLAVYDGERIAGAVAGFHGAEPPAGMTAAEYADAAGAHDARGRRSFACGWDHTVPDYRTLMRVGIGGLIDRARAEMAERREGKGATGSKKAVAALIAKHCEFLESVIVCLEAFSRFAQRYAARCREAGNAETANVLDRIALHPPRTLHEAMQLTWLTHIAMASEARRHNALGRVDQYWRPFYEADLAAGRITRDDALDLICHLWAKVGELGEVTNICIGGLTPEGDDGTNELSYLCLEATRLVQSPHTNLSARFHDGSPERLHRETFECLRTGVGFPAIFNDHVLVPGLSDIGIPPEVARDHCMVGCIETMLAGRQQAWSDGRFNWPLSLLTALERLRAEPVRTYERLCELFREQTVADLARYVRARNDLFARFPADLFPDPFLSALTRDCIGRARDVNDGGAEFRRFHGACFMGLATLADSLAAVHKLVFEEERVAYDDLMDALAANFEGREPLRQMLLNRAPKYGNADPYVDDIAADIVAWASEECLKFRTIDGGRFVAAMAANVANIRAGQEVGATPDGRLAGEPLSDAASPHFARDRMGPTAVLKSVAAPDYSKVLTGSVVNMKFDPEHFRGEEGATRFSAFTHAFVADRIQELQFNFTGDKILRDAMANPQKHTNLVVRVSGFSAYFVNLSPEVQNDVLRRRAHGTE